MVDALAEDCRKLFELFLNDYTAETDDGAELQGGHEYIEQAALMKQNDWSTMYVDFTHVMAFNSLLADLIAEHYQRVEEYLQTAISNFIKRHVPEHAHAKTGERLFFVSFFNFPVTSTLRDLLCCKVGQLMAVCGTVTRSSQVRPELILGNFRCLVCGTDNKNVRQQFKYTEPVTCSNAACHNKNKWHLDTKTSTFVDWQMVRVQENAQHIPAGSMPRSIKVILRNEVVEKAKPGDKSIFTGSLVVVPDVAQLHSGGAKGVKRSKNTDGGLGVSGLKALGVRDLTYKLAFLATNVRPQHSPLGDTTTRDEGEDPDDEKNVLREFSHEQRARIVEMSTTPRLYSRMIRSIAPTIFGHEEIKRGVLLMLMGGVHKRTRDGQNLRGDINVCIVGDPSTSKSQFLKYVCSFLPRAVYTSGKASSAAGLTASVVRDQETGEFAIEAGALMLADNSICCIDEFDKMDPKDQVAIHEAMEQQTISIAKAGIQATLNARTSILAAANPIHGRYDRSRTLRQNVDISAPIMSRFDLFFVVLDECEEGIDYMIARHILNTHRGKTTATKPDFSAEDLKIYLKYARTRKPKLSDEAKQALVDCYVELRGTDAAGSQRTAYRITVRQLESMVRLAEARARIDLSDLILREHVLEAARLLKKSIVNVESADVPLESYDPVAEEAEAAAEEEAGDRRELKLSLDQYKAMSKILVLEIRKREAAMKEPFTRIELVDWYIKQLEGELSGPEDLKYQTRLVKAVTERLVDVDKILKIQRGSAGDPDHQILGVHPNYDVEADTTEMTMEPAISDDEDDEGAAQADEPRGLSSDDDSERGLSTDDEGGGGGGGDGGEVAVSDLAMRIATKSKAAEGVAPPSPT